MAAGEGWGVAEFRDRRSFERWLKGKPNDWAQVLALRSALRELPLVAETRNPTLQIAVFRACAMSWASCRWPGLKVLNPPRYIPHARYAVADAADFASFSSWESQLAAARAAYAASAALDGDAAEAADHANPQTATKTWAALSAGDADRLENAPAHSAVLALLAAPLWLAEPAPAVLVLTPARAAALIANDPNMALWADWYQRRVAGSDSAFGLPAEADEAVMIRIATQEDDFWSRPPATVNAEIARWIAEATPPLAEPELQNPLVPMFTTDAQGRIALDVAADRTSDAPDAETVEHWALARDATLRAVAACEGNAGAYTRATLQRLADALGDAPGSIRPAALVLGLDTLRRELALRRLLDADSNLPPLADVALIEVRAAEGASNLLVALSPALSGYDVLLLGPDAVRAQVPRAEAQAMIASAAAAGITTDDASAALQTATDLAPQMPDPENRLSRRLSETVRNFGRRVASMVTAHLGKFLVGGVVTVGAVAVVEPATSAIFGGTVGVSYALGQWALRNEEKFRTMFADSPAMLALVDRLFTILRRSPLN